MLKDHRTFSSTGALKSSSTSLPAEVLQVLAEHPQRQRPGERLDDIRMAPRRQLVDQLRGDRLDARLELVHPARGERARDEAADAVVQRRVELRIYGILGNPSSSTWSTSAGSDVDEDLSAPVDEKVPVVLEHREDLLAAGHDPEVERGRVEDGLLASREREHVERVLPLLGRRRVEGDRRVHGHDVVNTVRCRSGPVHPLWAMSLVTRQPNVTACALHVLPRTRQRRPRPTHRARALAGSSATAWTLASGLDRAAARPAVPALDDAHVRDRLVADRRRGGRRVAARGSGLVLDIATYGARSARGKTSYYRPPRE